jgi:hypothetical protein
MKKILLIAALSLLGIATLNFTTIAQTINVTWSTNYVAVVTTNTTTIVGEEKNGYRTFCYITLVNSNACLVGPGGQDPKTPLAYYGSSVNKEGFTDNGSICAKTVSGVSTVSVWYGRGDLIK